MEPYEDDIHGTITLPSYVAVIVKHSLFQRLKFIRQLGFLQLHNTLQSSEIKHNRFKHSIGTCFLASKLLNILEVNTKGLQIPAVYRQAVELAALLHDIGHASFSHTWESVDTCYDHEAMSWKVIDLIFEEQWEELSALKKDNSYGIGLIKALITGKTSDFPYTLPQEYGFLFEIVSNKSYQIDVDKWDYLKRDHYFLSAYYSFDVDVGFDDFFQRARVSPSGLHIEYNCCDIAKILKLFRARWSFYMNCYCLPHCLISNEIFKKIIKRAKFYTQYQEALMKNERINDMFFEKFIDQLVCLSIKDDELAIFLNHSTKFIQMSCVEMEKEFNLDFYKYGGIVTISIPSVFQYFPKNNLHLYPNKVNFADIVDDTYTIRKHIRFVCNLSDFCVYFSCIYDYTTPLSAQRTVLPEGDGIESSAKNNAK